MAKKWVSVLIEDGNRTVSWEYTQDCTLRKVLTDWNFRWIPNSVSTNGLYIPDCMLDYTLDGILEQVEKFGVPYGKHADMAYDLYVGLDSVEEKKVESAKEDAEL